MGKEKVKNKNGLLILSNRLGKFERLNQEEMKVLSNQAVQGLPPVTVDIRRRKTVLYITAQNWYPLSAYLPMELDGETVLSYIWNTLRIAYDCERYGLRTDHLCWDADRVYLDAAQGTVNMIYWPVTTLEAGQESALRFFLGFCDPLARSGVDGSIVRTYSAYFYQRDHFDIAQFYGMVREILEQWRTLRYRERVDRDRRRDQRSFEPPKRDARFATNAAWLECRETLENISLTQQKTVIGRDPGSCGLLIGAEKGVSRCHAVITNRDGQYYLEDLDSRNGTFVQSKRVYPGERVNLVDGVVLRFGSAKYTFRKKEVSQTISIHDLQRR